MCFERIFTNANLVRIKRLNFKPGNHRIFRRHSSRHFFPPTTFLFPVWFDQSPSICPTFDEKDKSGSSTNTTGGLLICTCTSLSLTESSEWLTISQTLINHAASRPAFLSYFLPFRSRSHETDVLRDAYSTLITQRLLVNSRTTPAITQSPLRHLRRIQDIGRFNEKVDKIR